MAMGTLKLMESQKEHVVKLMDILGRSQFAMDFSMLGAGKTYTSSYIAKDFRHVVVIAPLSVKVKWLEMKKKYNVPLSYALSYSELRSSYGAQPKHGLLRRHDYTVDRVVDGETKKVKKSDFRVTDMFRDMVNEGVLLVVDEIQNVKNVTAQFSACQCMVREIVWSVNKSRVLLLSGSPIDKKEQVTTLFRTVGVMKSDDLAVYDLYTKSLEWRGARDIEDYCKKFDRDEVMRILNGKYEGRVEDKMLREYCYDLFQGVVRPWVSSAMDPPKVEYNLLKRNAYYEIQDPQDKVALSEGVFQLYDAIQKMAMVHNRPNGVLGDLNCITVAMKEIEKAKVKTFIRIAKEKLDGNPKMKVVVCVNYTETLMDIYRGLSQYKPMVLNGATSLPQRVSVIERFQAADMEHRVLVGNVQVCSTGIDLDDKDGGYPRFVLVSPNYNTITLYQLGHRFQRADTKSDATIHFVFGAGSDEVPLMNSLARKSIVMKETTKEQVEAGVVYPGDYERFDEQ